MQQSPECRWNPSIQASIPSTCRVLTSVGKYVVCTSVQVDILPGVLPPSQGVRLSIVFRVLYKQTNKQTNILNRHCESPSGGVCTTQSSISVYPLAKIGEDLQSVDKLPASKHLNIATNPTCSIQPNKHTKQTNKARSHPGAHTQQTHAYILTRVACYGVRMRVCGCVGSRASTHPYMPSHAHTHKYMYESSHSHSHTREHTHTHTCLHVQVACSDVSKCVRARGVSEANVECAMRVHLYVCLLCCSTLALTKKHHPPPPSPPTSAHSPTQAGTRLTLQQDKHPRTTEAVVMMATGWHRPS